MAGIYLAAIVGSIFCLGLIDHNYQLVWFKNKAATLKTVTILVAIFIIWDIVGINLGIFFTGDNDVLTGLKFGPEFPIEELFFLILLSYQSLILWTGIERLRG